MGKVSFPIPLSAHRFGDPDRLLLLHVRFEAQRYTSLLPEQDGARQTRVHGGGKPSARAPVSRTSAHAHPLKLRDPTVVFPLRYAGSTSPGISVRTRLIPVSPSGGSPPLKTSMTSFSL